MMYRFKIKLRDVKNPEVWRRIDIPVHFTFDQLHRAIQIAFNWSDSHLYEFVEKKKDDYAPGKFRISIPSEYDGEYEEKTMDSRITPISKIFNKRKTLTYIYDLGDSWRHDIRLEGIVEKDYPFAYCEEGQGATPPEDCGGVDGYKQLKDAFKPGWYFPNEEGETEADSYRQWLGLDEDEDWDPYFFPSQLLRIINTTLPFIENYN